MAASHAFERQERPRRATSTVTAAIAIHRASTYRAEYANATAAPRITPCHHRSSRASATSIVAISEASTAVLLSGTATSSTSGVASIVASAHATPNHSPKRRRPTRYIVAIVNSQIARSAAKNGSPDGQPSAPKRENGAASIG